MSLRLLQEAQEVARLGTYVFDVAADRWTSSPVLDGILGIDGSYERSTGTWLALVHPSMRADIGCYLTEEVLGRTGRFDREYRIVRANTDEEIWVHGLGTVEFDSLHRPVRMLGTIQDITARRKAEDVLRENESRFRSLVENTAEGVGIVDLQERFIFANRAADEIFGVEAGGLIGRSLQDFVAPDEFQAVNTKVHERKGREASQYQLAIRRPDGSPRTLILTTTTRMDPQGKPNESLGIFRDITEAQQVQAQLAQNDRLASMGMLAAGVAHEINNPLAYVLANISSISEQLPRLVAVMKKSGAALRSQLGEAALAEIVGADIELLDPRVLDELVECTAAALEGTRRITKISGGLNTFSRVERGGLERVDLNRAVENAATMAHNEVKFRASVVKDFAAVPPVLASEGKLSQVFLNLIINAAHAIGEGRVDENRISLRTWAEDGEVLAEVADTGKGISPRDLHRVFEPFFTTKKTGVGSGLGLAICKNIVSEFGGVIQVESEPGRGTRFVIRLRPHPTTPARPRDVASRRPPPQKRRGRILVVDDEMPIRRALARLLGKEHEIVAAASGREGQRVLQKDCAFDLIFCDMMMPDMNGMELHSWLASTNPTLAQRVVFISGGAFTPRATEYLASIDNAQLEKPFDPAMLRSFVSKRLAESTATDLPGVPGRDGSSCG